MMVFIKFFKGLWLKSLQPFHVYSTVKHTCDCDFLTLFIDNEVSWVVDICKFEEPVDPLIMLPCGVLQLHLCLAQRLRHHLRHSLQEHLLIVAFCCAQHYDREL